MPWFGAEVMCCSPLCMVLVLGVWGPSKAGHWSCRSLALVVGQVDAIIHFLSATAAPMSAKNCLDICMPLTAVEACLMRVAYKKRSSARTLGMTELARMSCSQGRIRRATIVMEKGHP